MRTRLGWCVLIVAVLASGCGAIPRQQLTQYKASFAEMNALSEEMLLDLDRAQSQTRERAAKKQREADRSKPAVAAPPFALNLADVPGTIRQKALDDVDTRREALRTIARYNDTLTALAEGKSTAEVQTAAAGFVQAVGKLAEVAGGAGVPGLGAAVQVVSILAAEVEKARLRFEFKRAIRDGAPKVGSILKIFQDDRDEHYKLRAILAGEEDIILLRDLRDLIDAVKMDLGRFAAPQAEDADLQLSALSDVLNRTLVGARNDIPYPVVVSFGTTGTRFGRTEYFVFRDRIARMKHLVDRHTEIVAQMQAFARASVQYVNLVGTTRTALQDVARTLDGPVDLTATLNEFVTVAFAVRRALEAAKAGGS